MTARQTENTRVVTTAYDIADNLVEANRGGETFTALLGVQDFLQELTDAVAGGWNSEPEGTTDQAIWKELRTARAALRRANAHIRCPGDRDATSIEI